VPPSVQKLRTLPPTLGGLWHYHVSSSSRPCLPAKGSSCAATCPTAPNLASLLRRGLVLPCVPQLSVDCGPQV
jgi:hypothetical protein